jgi:hypothetical protein
MAYHRTQFHVRDTHGPLVIAIKRKSNYIFFTAATFVVLCATKILPYYKCHIFSKICYIGFQSNTLKSASVAPALNFVRPPCYYY